MADIDFAVANMEFAVVTTHEQEALLTPPDSGFVQKRTIYERRVRHVSLSWDRADRAVVHDLGLLWSDTFGGVLLMNWTPPTGETAFEVAFANGPEFVLDRSGLDRYRVSVELEEAL